MPLTPPAALISLIANMVESCSDFSMIERPPVNEKRTPTLISPAACAPVWKTHGEVIAVPPASKPFLRNLRLSIAITPLPIFVRAHETGRAEARCPEPKSFQIRPITENATAPAAIHGPQKQKKPDRSSRIFRAA